MLLQYKGRSCPHLYYVNFAPEDNVHGFKPGFLIQTSNQTKLLDPNLVTKSEAIHVTQFGDEVWIE